MHIATPPDNPGVYQFKNSAGQIIYIGKAKNLRNRVRSYFGINLPDLKTEQLVSNIAEAEYIITDNELEALILESVLIKKHQPKYNIRLRDDKNYQFIKIDYALPIPQIYTVRKKDERYQSSAKYFGPYTSGLNARYTLRLIKKIFPYCLGKKVGSRPCFNYQLHRCPGVCVGEMSLAKYKDSLKQVEMFLQGRTKDVEKSLRQKMKKSARQKEYERAAVLRDQINALADLAQSQKVISMRPYHQDYVSMFRQDNKAAFNLFQVRSGKLTGRENILVDNLDGSSDGAALAAFLQRYYLDATNLPKEIITPLGTAEDKLVAELVSQRWQQTLERKQKIKIRQPRRGMAKKLMRLGEENARNFLQQQLAKFEKEEVQAQKGVAYLQDILDLAGPPGRIEAFDISNIQGTLAVGSMVVFVDGKPRKDQYRKFKIKTNPPSGGPDDYAMMAEVLRRRLKNNWPQPDLWIIDGGRGQLNVARKILKAQKAKIPVLALAKDRHKNTPENETDRERWQEKIYLPGKSEGIVLNEGHPAKTLVQKLRDEAHRFAVTYHRDLRSRNLFGR